MCQSVTCCRNHLAGSYSLATDGADFVAGISVFCASGFRCIPDFGCVVAGCRDYCIAQADFHSSIFITEILLTSCAVPIFDIALGGAFGINSLVMCHTVTCCRNRFGVCVAANRASISHFSRFGAGWLLSDCAGIVSVITGRRYYRSGCYRLAANGADLVAGVTILTAGCILGVLDFGGVVYYNVIVCQSRSIIKSICSDGGRTILNGNGL